MPDTQKAVKSDPQASRPSNALVYRESVPHWDVYADEVAYPFTVEEQRREYLVYVFLRQHTDPAARKGFTSEYARALREATTDMKMQGDSIEIPILRDEPLQAFVTAHFARFEGLAKKDADPERHRRYLDQRPFLKTRIFQECLQRVAVKEDGEEAESGGESSKFSLLDLDFSSSESAVALHQPLYSPAKDRLEEVVLNHVLLPEMESEYREWRKARTSKYNTRRRLFTTTENHEKLASIYGRIIVRVEGLLCDNAPCVEGNKEAWVPLVPLVQKLLVLDAAFRKTLEKNV